uniref:Uncharacterized protein n=1 Tax=uncultured Armatimonadetes bacterium TaxID=157466 RepID=A0A6J4H1U1_9BACT|nr:hypothetical protein AVDCRST_MAG63-1558 [uncultured Armatimonadetes bacterium]
MQQRPAKRGGSPLLLILAVLLLVGMLAVVNRMSRQNATTYEAHDHNRDGRPDHGADAHR